MQKEKLDIDLLIAALKAIIIWENYRIIDDFLPSQMVGLLMDDVLLRMIILNQLEPSLKQLEPSLKW